MRKQDVLIPVEVGNGLKVEIGATIFTPEAGPGSAISLLAVPGGQYDRTYWHRVVPGLSGYSFAEDMVGRGHTVVAIDNLGTGVSTRPEDADTVTISAMGEAVAAVAAKIRSGEVAAEDSSATAKPAMVVGVGHSLGGQITATAQAFYRPFDAAAILGSSFTGNGYSDGDGRAAAEAHLRKLAGPSWDTGYLTVPFALLQSNFHLPDVPEALLKAEEQSYTVLPRQAGIFAVDSSVMAEPLRDIDAPVFLAYGEADVSPDQSRESAVYSGSPDVTFFRLRGSAHCHNGATTRQLLWDRLALVIDSWRATVGPTG